MKWDTRYLLINYGRFILMIKTDLKFDQDKTFGSVDIRRAFNQVRILDKHDYGKNGEWVALMLKQ